MCKNIYTYLEDLAYLLERKKFEIISFKRSSSPGKVYEFEDKFCINLERFNFENLKEISKDNKSKIESHFYELVNEICEPMNHNYFKKNLIQFSLKLITEEELVFVIHQLGHTIHFFHDEKDVLYSSEKINNTEISNIINIINSDNRNLMSELQLSVSDLMFRGHGDFNFELLPGAGRTSNNLSMESIYYHEAINRFPNEFQDTNNHLEVLKKCQHYGVPTRLLDVTMSLEVGLYFMASTETGQIGELISFVRTNCSYGDMHTLVLSSLAALPMGVKQMLYQKAKPFKLKLEKINRNLIELKGDRDTLEKDKERLIRDFNSLEAVKPLRHEIQKENINLTDEYVNPLHLFEPVFVKTTLDNPRIRAQMGAFILIPLIPAIGHEAIDSLEILKTITQTRCSKGSHIYHYVFSSSAKKRLLKELNDLGVNNLSIYPEITSIRDYVDWQFGYKKWEELVEKNQHG